VLCVYLYSTYSHVCMHMYIKIPHTIQRFIGWLTILVHIDLTNQFNSSSNSNFVLNVHWLFSVDVQKRLKLLSGNLKTIHSSTYHSQDWNGQNCTSLYVQTSQSPTQVSRVIQLPYQLLPSFTYSCLMPPFHALIPS